MTRSPFPAILIAVLSLPLANCTRAPRRAGERQQPAPAPPPSVATAARPTGRGWLVGNEPEPAGFGLYSYLLFGSLPSDATRPVYVAIVKASLGKIEPIETKIRSGYTPAQLNLFMIPLYRPPGDIKADDLPSWLVDQYAYSRAQRLLAAVPQGGKGIYIVSVLAKPIDVSRQLSPPYLWQNLSNVQPAIAAAWIQYFIDQAAKDKPWDESSGEKLALNLRNYIEQTASEVNVTLPAMASAVRWFEPGS